MQAFITVIDIVSIVLVFGAVAVAVILFLSGVIHAAMRGTYPGLVTQEQLYRIFGKLWVCAAIGLTLGAVSLTLRSQLPVVVLYVITIAGCLWFARRDFQRSSFDTRETLAQYNERVRSGQADDNDAFLKTLNKKEE